MGFLKAAFVRFSSDRAVASLLSTVKFFPDMLSAANKIYNIIILYVESNLAHLLVLL